MKKDKKTKYSGLSKLYILIGFVLILILWNIGLNVHWGCGGGFYIDLCLDLIIDYYWTSAGYISVFFFIVWVYLLIKGRKIKKEEQKQKNARLMLSTGILSIVIFYIFSPLSYYYTPNFLQNRNWDLSFSIDKYIKNIEKYCYSDFRTNLYKSNWELCKIKHKTYIEFKNLDYNIKIFKYANINNIKNLYANNFYVLKDNSLLKILRKYKNRDIYIQ